MKKLCDLIARCMGLLVLGTGAVALFIPQALNWIAPVWINPLLGLVMFGMGLTLNADDFKGVFKQPKDVFIGCLAQFSIMPGLAWLLTRIFNLPDDLALGVILVGSCPGGTASNIITYLAKGDLALSVSMTAASTVLAPLLTPFFTWLLAGKFVDVNAMSMFFSILQVVIIPIAAGFLIQRFFPKFTKSAVSYLPAVSSIAIALVIGIVVAANSAKLMHSGLLVILVVMLHNLCGLSLGYGMGTLFRLKRKKCVTLSIEVGMQNSALASSLATLHFAAYPMAAIPGAVFSVWHNVSGAVAASLYSRITKEE